MKLIEIYSPDLKLNVRYRLLTPGETEAILVEFGESEHDVWAQAIIEHVVYNLKDITNKLRRMTREKGHMALDTLFNGCLMLNPTLDAPSWLQIANAPRLAAFEEPRPPKAVKVGVRPRRLVRSKFLNLERHLKDIVVGQDEAVAVLVNSLKRSHVGLGDENRPMGVFLFAGSSGVGKSYVAKELHKYLFPDAEMVRIDCGEYQLKHENQKLIGCFVPDTKILMASGVAKAIEKVAVGDRVITHTGMAKSVVETFCYDQDGSMVELTTGNSNMPLVTTAGHEILAIKTEKKYAKFLARRDFRPFCQPENLQFVSASQLEENDIVVYPRWKGNVEPPPVIDLWDYVTDRHKFHCDETSVWAFEDKKVRRFIPVDNAFMRLAGYYVSQGGNSKAHKSFNFTISHQKSFQMDEIERLLKEVFDMGDRPQIATRKSTLRLYASSMPISLMLSDLFGANVYQKRVPEFMLSLSDELVSNFLETAIFGDGSTAQPRRVQYDTVSSDLHYAMELLLRRLGFATQVQLRKPSKPGWKDCYRIYIAGTQIVRFAQMMSGLDINLRGLGETGIQRMAFVDDDYIYLRLKKVNTAHYTGPVYDFKVEDDASYVAHSVSVHNSPPGYLGHDEGGQLTNQMLKNPGTVVLLDEVEKAHIDVWNTFLRVFDEGFMTDGSGKTVSFKDAIIIMTTNLGNADIANELQTQGFGFSNRDNTVVPKRSRVVGNAKEAIRKNFRPEFLNRVDNIVVFNHLTDADYKKIAELELSAVRGKLEKRGYALAFDETVVNAAVRDGINHVQGARGLAQLRRERIENPLADSILTGRHPKGTVFRLSYSDAEGYRVTAKRPAVKKRVPIQS